MPRLIACLFLLLWWNEPVVATDLQVERALLIEQLVLDASSGTARVFARGGTSCPGEQGRIHPLSLPLDSVEAELLYALLLSAHLGERRVAVWFDVDLDCRILQGQLAD